MRIISGKYRSRIIKMVDSITTRETTDKVRGAIFNIINPYFDRGLVLDLFAGSGAMGIEAISRGANYCFFNDINPAAIKVINDNLKSLKIEEYSLIRNDYKEALMLLSSQKLKFDLVFLDPPYKFDVIDDIISFLIENDMLNPFAIIVCEYKKEMQLKDNQLYVLKDKEYGIRKVTVFSNGEL